MSIPFGVTLWREYLGRAMADSIPENRLVTHYESHFADPRAEIQRILQFLSFKIPETALDEVSQTCKTELRNNRLKNGEWNDMIPKPFSDFYEELCSQAGPVFAEIKNGPGGDPSDEAASNIENKTTCSLHPAAV
jgi:hypothetical protein